MRTEPGTIRRGPLLGCMMAAGVLLKKGQWSWVQTVVTTTERARSLVPAVGSKAQKLALHRIDLGEISGDEVIAAALAGDHLKATARVGRGGAGAAEMDECGEILL